MFRLCCLKSRNVAMEGYTEPITRLPLGWGPGLVREEGFKRFWILPLYSLNPTRYCVRVLLVLFAFCVEGVSAETRAGSGWGQEWAWLGVSADRLPLTPVL